MACYERTFSKSLFAVAVIALSLLACGDPDSPGVDAGVDGTEPSDDFACDTDPGSFGCQCEGAADCDSGLCVPSSRGGSACADSCTDSCPDGWACEAFPDGQTETFACVEVYNLCRPCRENAECEAGDYGQAGDRCVDYGEEQGAFCGSSCTEDMDCPLGYACETMADIETGEESDQCVPSTGACGCTPGAIDEEAATDCSHSACTGERICGQDGLGECSAAYPSDEVCDGLDNNCSGQVDESFSDTDTDGTADCIDPDDDGDEIDDESDNCPLVQNDDQLDVDLDGAGDACDPLEIPVLTGTDPADTGNINTISVQGTAEASSVVQLFTDAACSASIGSTVVANAGTGVFVTEITVEDNTTTTLWGATTSSAGQSACSTSSATYIEDSVMPGPPALTATDPASPGNTTTPKVIGTAEAGAAIRLYTDSSCSGNLLGEGTTTELEAAGISTTGITANTTVQFYGTATDAAGNPSPCSTGLEYIHDDDPPAAPVLAGTTPVSPSSVPNPTVQGTGDAGTVISIHTVDDCSDAAIASSDVPGGGNFDFEISVPLNQETLQYGKVTDVANNESPCSTPALSYLHDDQAPIFAGLQTATSGSDVQSFTVSWTAANDNLTDTADIVYEICAAEEPIVDDVCPGEAVITSDPGATSLEVDDAEEARRYWIRVRAKDEAGNTDVNQVVESVLTLGQGVVVSFASGRSSSDADSEGCALLGDGTVACFDHAETELFDVSGVGNATYLSRGSNTDQPDHFCVRHADGTGSCWGGNVGGHLGTGDELASDLPVDLAKHNENIITVEPIDGNTCSSYFVDDVSDPNEVRCWGTGFEDAFPSNPATPNAHRTIFPLGDNCTIGPMGWLRCWSLTATPETHRVGNPTGSFVDIEAGRLGLRANGNVFGWDFQNENDTDITQVFGLNNGRDLAASAGHGCIARTDGHALCWGNNDSMQLTRNTPNGLGIVDTGLTNIVAVSAGDAHSCAVTGNGRIWCFGAGFGAVPSERVPVQRDLIGRIGGTDIAVGGDHTCGRRSDGQLKCWGRDALGQLGDGTADADRHTPARVIGIPDAGVDTIPGNEDDRWVVDVATGENHTCAAMSDGSVFCWGANNHGQLGIGSTSDDPNPTPQQVTGLTNVRALTAGYRHTCAIKGDGTARCWGDNLAGQLGTDSEIPSDEPVQVKSTVTAHDIGAGDEITCARDFNGQIRCWGTGFGGLRVDIQGALGTATLAVGASHGCATFHTGTAVCWGSNTDGQLGNGTTITPAAATESVEVAGISHLVAVTAGAKHTCGLRADGTVWCWGDNNNGQLGNSTRVDSLTPVQVLGLTDVRAVEAGLDHTCALMGDGTVQCWGDNGAGKCGAEVNPDLPVFLTPNPVDYFP